LGRLETDGEELDPLCLVEVPGAWQQRLEPILVLLDRAGALARRQFAERVGTEGWAVTEVQELLEPAPGRGALVLLHLDVPHLGAFLQIVGGHPDLLLHDPLLMEVGFTSIEEDQGVGLAIIAREVEFLESRGTILMVFACGEPVAGGGGRLLLSVAQALDRQGIGLHCGSERFEGFGQGVQRCLEGIGVGHGSGVVRGELRGT